ncbi:MAG TPA: hypothetical protein VKG43_14830 [Acidimicrobiales bacterium]|nr:hypothetical protein [Acidimicrobiales bacterium]
MIGHRAVAGVALLTASALLAGCAGQEQSGTPAQRVSTWVTGTGFGATIGTLHGDAQRVDEAVRMSLGTAAVHTVCALLTTDSQSANNDLPTPDDQLTQKLASAYSLEYDAGNDCFTAGAANRSLLARSARERRRAEALLDQALARVTAVSGLVVSTTTTTAPGGGGGGGGFP